MARKCILCGKEYKYCNSCKNDTKKETWHTLYDTENCKNISKALTDYNLKVITKEDARKMLSQCDVSIDLKEIYRGEIEEIMSKPKRGLRAKANIIDELITDVEPVEEDATEDLNGVVTIE